MDKLKEHKQELNDKFDNTSKILESLKEKKKKLDCELLDLKTLQTEYLNNINDLNAKIDKKKESRDIILSENVGYTNDKISTENLRDKCKRVIE